MARALTGERRPGAPVVPSHGTDRLPAVAMTIRAIPPSTAPSVVSIAPGYGPPNSLVAPGSSPSTARDGSRSTTVRAPVTASSAAADVERGTRTATAT